MTKRQDDLTNWVGLTMTPEEEARAYSGSIRVWSIRSNPQLSEFDEVWVRSWQSLQCYLESHLEAYLEESDDEPEYDLHLTLSIKRVSLDEWKECVSCHP